ncbi:MAG: hypothetical protein GTN99_08075 [Candidatus Dadabacteria bacterium]|nr:hypothetical protein [Candidatus Dadabacteria bacterium]
MRLSTGLRNAMLGTASFDAEFTACFINIYSGPQPASADDAITGSNTLLATIYSDGAALGLNFDAPVSGTISKAAAETWSGTALASGTAAWFRLYEAGDTPANLSTTASRVDGSIGISGGDMNISNTTITVSAVQTITQFDVTLPAS